MVSKRHCVELSILLAEISSEDAWSVGPSEENRVENRLQNRVDRTGLISRIYLVVRDD